MPFTNGTSAVTQMHVLRHHTTPDGQDLKPCVMQVVVDGSEGEHVTVTTAFGATFRVLRNCVVFG